MWKKETHSDGKPESMANNMESKLDKEVKPASMRSVGGREKVADNSQTIISAQAIASGKIEGNSDVQISGKFEGSLNIPKNTVTVELSGFAQASLSAKNIIVHGTVNGNLYGSESVHIISSGVVDGDIKSANVILEKSCKFNGSIEMIKEPAKETPARVSTEKSKEPDQSKPTVVSPSVSQSSAPRTPV